jgi:hypothetical protein
MSKKNPIAGIDYYIEDSRVVFTEKYHKERGQCCGSGCRHCPFIPKHKKGNKELEVKR